MMKTFSKKFIITFNIMLLLLPLNLLSFTTPQKAKAEDNDIDPPPEVAATVLTEDIPDGGDGSNDDALNPAPVAQLPNSIKNLISWTDSNFSTSPNTPTGGFLWASENITANPKLVLNIRTRYI